MRVLGRVQRDWGTKKPSGRSGVEERPDVADSTGVSSTSVLGRSIVVVMDGFLSRRVRTDL
jgi:hypothetical protein